MNIKKILTSSIIGVFVLVFSVGVALAITLSSTDFEGFTLGASVDGQGGWSATGSWDEEIVDDGSNRVWRVSNAVTSGSFGDMPFAPRPGGFAMDTTTDPVGGTPQFFAGEFTTGADYREFRSEFQIKSSTGASQAGLRITVSADNGQGGRQSFVGIEDTGTGLRVTTFDYNSATSTFDGPITIADGLSYTDWHSIGVDIEFVDGSDNDVVRYFVNGNLVYTGPSWEEFYRDYQSALHPMDVPVQTLLYRLSGTAVSDVSGQGFYIDNVSIETGLFSTDPTDKDDCKDGGWEAFGFSNQGRCIQFVNTGKDSR